MGKTLHSGHRERVRKKFLSDGFTETTPEHEVLEMLLFYSVPYKDTNELAHTLINHFGSLCGVLDARPDDLLKIKGISENTVALLKLVLPVARIYGSTKLIKPKQFDSINDLGNFLLTKYIGYGEEVLSITCLDSCGRFLSYDVIEKGDISSVGVSTRAVIETVLKRNSNCAVMAHNHPGGIALPSGEDIAITETVKNALSHIGVRLIDHIIIANDDFVSLAQSVKYKEMF